MKRFAAYCLLAVLALCGVLGAFLPAQGECRDKGKTRNIALLRMEVPKGFHLDERLALASDFLHALHQTGVFVVVSRDNMEQIIQELKFQASDLVDQDEVVELGGLLGVDHFVTCNIRLIKGIYQVTANLINVETARDEKIVVKRCEGKFDYLPALFNEIAYDMAGIEGQKGLLRIESDPVEAEVSIFGISQGYTPISINLAPGTYVVRLEKWGCWDWEKELQVSAEKEVFRKVTLRKKKRRKLGEYIGGKSIWGKD